MYASTIMDEVAADLHDEEALDSDRRWPRTDLLEYLNAGERTLVFLLPTAYVVTGVFQLVAGSKQSLPDGTSSFQDPSAATLPQAIEPISFNRNMGSDGQTPGNAISPIKRDVLDRTVPGWHTATASADIDHSIYDPRDRNNFSVYPPQPSSDMGWIEVPYSAVPPEIVAGAGPDYDVDINLEDSYAEPLKHYMRFRAYSKDSAQSQDAASRALSEWNNFVLLIGRKDMVEKKYTTLTRRMNDGDFSKPVPR